MKKFIYGVLLSLITTSCRETDAEPIDYIPVPGPEQVIVNEGPVATDFQRLRYKPGYDHQSFDDGRIWITEVGINKHTGTVWIIGEKLNVPCAYVRFVTAPEVSVIEASLQKVDMCRYAYAYAYKTQSAQDESACANFLPTPSLDLIYVTSAQKSYQLEKLGYCSYGPATCEASAAAQLVGDLNTQFANDALLCN